MKIAPPEVKTKFSDEEDLERLLLANSPTFQAMLDAAEQRIQETGGVSHKDVWEEVEK
jgi:hypothetical protein